MPPTHRPPQAPRVALPAARAAHDRTRPSAARRGYDRRWRKYARAFLAEHPVCAHCQRAADHVDHVVAVDGPGDPRFWDAANHQPLCQSCHSRKTAREDGALRRAASSVDRTHTLLIAPPTQTACPPAAGPTPQPR